MTTIYGLYIGERCIYVGKTVRTIKERNGGHKSDCYNENSKSYGSLKNKTIRNEFKIEKNQYYKQIKIEQIYSNVPKNYAGVMEDFTINLYRDFGYELLNEIQALDYTTCHHGLERQYCIECDGIGICIHKRQKKSCITCNGNQVCIHKRRKELCKLCHPMVCNVCGKIYSKDYIKRHQLTH